MLLPDQRPGLIAYITARLELDVDAERRGIADTDTDQTEAAEWDWVKQGRQQRQAIRNLVKTIEPLDQPAAEQLLIGLAAIWAEHPPLVDRRRLPYTSSCAGLVYLTECHLATATISGGVMCCRSCYEQVDEVLAVLPGASTVDTPWRGQPTATAD